MEAVKEPETVGMMRLLNDRPDLSEEELEEYVKLGKDMEELIKEKGALQLRVNVLHKTPKKLREGRFEEFVQREKDIISEYEGLQKRYEFLREKIFRPKK